MRIAKPVQRVIDCFSKLPGIGPKSAQKLAYYLLHVPQVELDNFAVALSDLKRKTMLCKECKNVSETDLCPICSDSSRNKKVLMVVEQPMDLLAIEKSGRFNGVYHVLHGAINPLENIGPDEIFVDALIMRLQKGSGLVEEMIIATNPTMEGEATAMVILNKLKKLDMKTKVTRLGIGIPTGADLEYADELTLRQAIDGRREL
ncbi:MAG: recombination mediator RecR [Patescibacteria group bacterium]|nr:recombination mediator RecR [Patescibacteria group bacterium]